MCADLLWPEMTGECSCSQRRVPEVLVQVPWVGQTHRYFWTAAEPVGVSFPPSVLYLSARGVCSGLDSGSHWGPPGSSHDHVLCFHRAAPSYFSPATARPAHLSTCLPEVNFQKQVRTPGEGGLVTWP